ncbi:DUF1506 family protein, partial [Borreliella americana]
HLHLNFIEIIGGEFFVILVEIVSIDSSIGYFTLVLKEFIWTI